MGENGKGGKIGWHEICNARARACASMLLEAGTPVVFLAVARGRGGLVARPGRTVTPTSALFPRPVLGHIPHPCVIHLSPPIPPNQG